VKDEGSSQRPPTRSPSGSSNRIPDIPPPPPPSSPSSGSSGNGPTGGPPPPVVPRRIFNPFPSYSHSSLKATPPRKYDGSPRTSVGDWLFTVDQYFTAARAQPEEKVPYAAIMLEGNALIWWKALVFQGIAPTT
jgi:hypothetical protein